MMVSEFEKRLVWINAAVGVMWLIMDKAQVAHFFLLVAVAMACRNDVLEAIANKR